ncbi:MAG: 4Fe-4S binding protein [Candidatus Bipolaricaulota bacterium]|nr:4Fe-4S binding protein [Candidatus Bipolaricaulota bacterium]
MNWPIRRSTWALVREGRRVPGYRVRDFLHGYVYARWPYLYIRAATRPETLSRPLRILHRWAARLLVGSGTGAEAGRRFADTYHGKVVPTSAAEGLVTLRVNVELRDLEKVIPYATARDIVLRGPDRIVALECPCRAARDEPCLPLDVCLIVGEPFASFVADHHPRRARWITQDEAVTILRAERDRGHVHHAFFKDAMLGRFYAICNCCPCCCGAMQAWRHGTPMLAPSGYVASLDAALCRGCGACAARCPFGAIAMGDGQPVLDGARCMGCGVCAFHCPAGALHLVRAPEKGEPLEIQALIQG